jgi:hypothetical protein
VDSSHDVAILGSQDGRVVFGLALARIAVRGSPTADVIIGVAEAVCLRVPTVISHLFMSRRVKHHLLRIRGRGGRERAPDKQRRHESQDQNQPTHRALLTVPAGDMTHAGLTTN